MHLLEGRAESIIKKKQGNQEWYEEQIRRHLDNHWDEASVPREAFVTFATEEAYQRAL